MQRFETFDSDFCFFSRYHLGADLLSSGSVVGESLLKDLWQYQDAILCCSLKVQQEIIFFLCTQKYKISFFF
ncbi:putative class III homeodomain-leucine zipper family [Helianthus annuus]|nr:putative class III homeodomain-leucine zipper family [Helianthus annuus]